MAPRKGEEHPPEPRRKEIFLALVVAQDHDTPVPESRKLIADRFGLTEGQVQGIDYPFGIGKVHAIEDKFHCFNFLRQTCEDRTLDCRAVRNAPHCRMIDCNSSRGVAGGEATQCQSPLGNSVNLSI